MRFKREGLRKSLAAGRLIGKVLSHPAGVSDVAIWSEYDDRVCCDAGFTPTWIRMLPRSRDRRRAFGSKADVTLLNFDVRFTSESGRSWTRLRCPLRANNRRYLEIGMSAKVDRVCGPSKQIIVIQKQDWGALALVHTVPSPT